MDFELRPVARGVRFGVAKDIIFVVTPDDQPAGVLLFILHKTQTFKRSGSPVYHISGYNHQIGLPCFEVRSYGLQSDQIGVNIG